VPDERRTTRPGSSGAPRTQAVQAGREGGVHFAGERTDTGRQGYIENAVRTGGRAARELLR